jgi:hypothetical protein
MGRGAESIRPFREALPLEVRDYIGGEVRKPLPHKACSAGRRHKKGELGSVHLFKLVEAAGVRVFVRFANYDIPPYGRQPFPSGAGSAVTAAENKKGPLDIESSFALRTTTCLPMVGNPSLRARVQLSQPQKTKKGHLI